MIEKTRVRKVFKDYVKGYNEKDPKIALKISHTYRVADMCEEIAESLDLTKEEQRLSWLLGMLHDIGRFEQVRIFNTFVDSQSVDHAEFGADILFKQRMIEEFIDDRSQDKLIEAAIRNHNKFRIDESVTGKGLVLSEILRDADKIDILRVNIDTPMEDIYNTTTEILLNSDVSPEVMEQVRNRQCITREVRKTPVDHLIGHLALCFELVFPRSRKFVIEQGYLEKLCNFPTKNLKTRECIKETKEYVLDFLKS